MSYNKAAIALCPECALSAHRKPDLDKPDQIAFKCDGTHPVFWLPLASLPPEPVAEEEPPKKPRSHR